MNHADPPCRVDVSACRGGNSTRGALAQGDAPPTILRLINWTIEVNGKPASVYGIRQPDGTAGLTTHVGDRFRVRVENQIGKPSLVHWHGLAPPWRQDGVPGVSGPPIPPGGSADYDFPLDYGGTFWMHSHEGLQEQLLFDAPLIIRDQRDKPGQQEIVLMLNDFSFTSPEEIFANLKKGSSMPGMAGGGMPAVSGKGNAKPTPASVKAMGGDGGDGHGGDGQGGAGQSRVRYTGPERCDL